MIDPNYKKSRRREPRARNSNTLYKVLLLISILFVSGGQIFMKCGTKALGGITFDSNIAAELLKILFSPYIMAGVLFMLISTVLTMGVLAKLELSYATAISTLSYVLVLLLSRLIFAEHIDTLRISGVAFIMLGIILVSRTEKNTEAG
jgi:drug/metabolite transporter (DMT)-like permease